jgi:hypothetical protein
MGNHLKRGAGGHLLRTASGHLARSCDSFDCIQKDLCCFSNKSTTSLTWDFTGTNTSSWSSRQQEVWTNFEQKSGTRGPIQFGDIYSTSVLWKIIQNGTPYNAVLVKAPVWDWEIQFSTTPDPETVPRSFPRWVLSRNRDQYNPLLPCCGGSGTGGTFSWWWSQYDSFWKDLTGIWSVELNNNKCCHENDANHCHKTSTDNCPDNADCDTLVLP